jgi:hypothetical protein
MGLLAIFRSEKLEGRDPLEDTISTWGLTANSVRNEVPDYFLTDAGAASL